MTTPRDAIAGKTVHWFVVHPDGPPKLARDGRTTGNDIQIRIGATNAVCRGMGVDLVEFDWQVQP